MNTIETVQKLNQIEIDLLDIMLMTIKDHQSETCFELEKVYEKIRQIEDEVINGFMSIHKDVSFQ